MSINSHPNDFNLNAMCYACLGKFVGMTNLQGEDEKARNLRCFFIEVAGIEYKPRDDTFHICTACEGKVYAAYAFREQCKKSDGIITYYCTQQELQTVQDEMSVASSSEPDIHDDSTLGFNDDVEETDSVCAAPAVVEEKRYRCSMCKLYFQSLENYQSHVKGHKGQPFRCLSCQLPFVTRLDLKEHVKAKHCEKSEPKNFCVECNKKVRSLDVHTELVHRASGGDETVGKLCAVCGKTFKNNNKLDVHMRMHTGETPYACKVCGRRMNTKYHLVLHMRTHTGERPHVCHVCGKGFAQSSVLNTHMRLHNGKTEVCNICGKGFCRPAELRVHMRSHTGEKPFRCRTCGQTFVQMSHLTSHEATHTDERPFVCHICNRGFKQRSTLKSHEHIHSGKKPFRCSLCFYACRQSYSLTQHMKQHTQDKPQPDNPHACAPCNKTFATHALLSLHNDTVHNSAYSDC